jgi:hypothetical protein
VSLQAEGAPVDGDATQRDRLDELEAAEIGRVASRQLDRRFELFEAIVLSIAAVLAAWTGFQSAKWSGVQADSYSRAGASRVESSRASTLAGQQSTVDVITFTQWLQAAVSDGALNAPPNPDAPYIPDPNTLSGFLYQRFRPEFGVAVNAWVATRPRSNADAPPTPFAMPEYHLAAATKAATFEKKAEEQAAGARQANQRSDNYVLMTITFATVLFFAGISSKMDTFRARAFLLGTATVILVGAFATVSSFPIEV